MSETPSRNPTLFAIAETAGASIGSVSKALNGRPGVGRKLRLHILKIAKDLGYDSCAASRHEHVFMPESRFVATLIGSVAAHISIDLQYGMNVALRTSSFLQAHCALDLSCDDAARKEMRDVFLYRIEDHPGIAGLLAACVEVREETRARLEERGVPVVMIDGPDIPGTRNLSIDHEAASRMAIEALIKRGRRRIAYVGPPPEDGWIWRRRHRSIETTLIQAGRPFLFEPETSCEVTRSSVAIRRLLRREPETDAIIFGSDDQAVAGLKVLNEIGIEVPRRVMLIGFDDSVLCRVAVPTLSSVRLPYVKLAEKGMQWLLQLIKSPRKARVPSPLAPRLVLRDSCLRSYRDDRWYRRS